MSTPSSPFEGIRDRLRHHAALRQLAKEAALQVRGEKIVDDALRHNHSAVGTLQRFEEHGLDKDAFVLPLVKATLGKVAPGMVRRYARNVHKARLVGTTPGGVAKNLWQQGPGMAPAHIGIVGGLSMLGGGKFRRGFGIGPPGV